VSLENNCYFCATAHRAIGKKSGINPQTVESLLNNQPIKDAKDDALVTLTRAIVRERGWLADEQIDAFIDSGFTKQQVFEVILVVTIKTLSNYSNHLTKPEVNPELLGML
jgi:alkylhydroperoxidase family enzyme